MPLTPLVLLFACNDGGGGATVDGEPSTDAPTPTETETGTPDDTGTPTTGDTGEATGHERPGVLEVTCAPTPNALRFTCDVTVQPAQPVELSFVRADGVSVARTVAGPGAASDHTLPLYFMAPQQDYVVTAWATAWPQDTATTTVTTGTPPSVVESYLDVTGSSTMGMIGTHLPCGSDAIGVVYDTGTGELLWYQLLDAGGALGTLDMIEYTEDFTVLGESRGDVIEVDLMGNDLVRLNDQDTALGIDARGTFGNFHHDIMKRNGAYYTMYQETYGSGGFFPDVLDVIVIFDATGAELARWYPDQHLTLPPNWSGDFLHTNTVYVDEAGDIYLSWLTQDSIGKIEGDWTSPDFGRVHWILEGRASGRLQGTITTDWSAIDGPDAFDDPHSLVVRPDGRVQLLDNRNGRGLILDVDEKTATATVDGAYATRQPSCGPQGTSRSTRAGNVVVGCTGDWVREYDLATGAMIWEAEVQCPTGGFGSQGAARWYPLDGW